MFPDDFIVYRAITTDAGKSTRQPDINRNSSWYTLYLMQHHNASLQYVACCQYDGVRITDNRSRKAHVDFVANTVNR